MKKINRYFGLRLEITAFTEIEKIAEHEHLSVSSLLRKWIMERLDQVRGIDKNG